MNDKTYYGKMDPMVIPMVEYFNANGLETFMSCQGHSRINMSMFWIEFEGNVSKKDIIKFQNNHLNKSGNFCSNGYFANNLYMCDGEICRGWRYFAATIDAADDDLKKWISMKNSKK